MNFRTLKVGSVLGMALLPLVGLLLLPSLAVAQTGVASGALLEVRESPPPQAVGAGPDMPGNFPTGIGGRLAEATEVGSLAGSGTLAFLTGQVELHAQSRIPFDPVTGFGVGTIAGVFNIDNGSNGAVVGKIDGSLDFTLFNPTPENPLGVPLAPTAGSWTTLGKNRTGGGFKGVALVPFACPLGFGACYLELDADGNPTGGLTPLTDNEFMDGVPLAKFMFTLFQ